MEKEKDKLMQYLELKELSKKYENRFLIYFLVAVVVIAFLLLLILSANGVLEPRVCLPKSLLT